MSPANKLTHMSFIKNTSIKNKLIIMVLLVSIPAIVIAFSIIMVKDIIQLRADLVSTTQLDAELVGEYSISPLTFEDQAGLHEVMEKLRYKPSIVRGYVYDSAGTLKSSYTIGGDTTGQIPPTVPEKKISRFIDNYLHVALPIMYERGKKGTIYLVASTTLLDENTRTRILSLVLVMAGAILFSYLLARGLQGVISKPVLKLAGVTEQISREIDYSIRVQPPGRDEIGTLYKGFNLMLEQIQLHETRRDQAEAEQQRLLVELEQKNKELEQVVYVTSHDLRSPLVNIQGFGQELNFSLRELESALGKIEKDPEEAKAEIATILKEDIGESLKYINSSTTKMDALLSGLLKLSRVGRITTTFEVLNMNVLISEVANALEFHLKEADATLEIEDLPGCFGSETEINQVFSNLITNAIRYRDPQRPAHIKISGHPSGQGGQSVYYVADNGIGIPQEYQKKIFQIFHRLRPDDSEGEGLGLAIVHKVVNRHKGTIRVESESGKGSTFIITLPSALRPGTD